MYDLRGKVALVTGAGGERGIGRAVAKRLASEGADVAVNDVTEKPYDTGTWGGMPAVVAEIEAAGGRSLGLVGDVSDAAQVEGMVERVVGHFGRIDILVNNAGSRPGPDRVPVLELSEEAWDQVQRTNLKGTFLCSQAAARAMVAQGERGKIINMSSTAGRVGMARYAAYCASKFAVIGFTQTLALELAEFGINVNAICPGTTETERTGLIAAALEPQAQPDQAREKMVAQLNAQTPLGRVAQAEDIARAAAFLASAESDYMTGASMVVAGGIQVH